MPSRASATATPLRRCDTCSNMASTLRVERRDQRRRARPRCARATPCSSACSAVIARSVRLRPPSARRRASASARFSAGGQLVGLEHPLEHLVLERLDLGLREGDLVLDGVIFLVGLHRHRLLAELRQAALVHGDVLLDRAPRVLVLGEPFLGGGHLLRAASSRRRAPFRRSGSSASRRRRRRAGRVEPLQRDQAFEISIHQCSGKQKKPRRVQRSLEATG